MKKCNTCGKTLLLPIGADHLMCALRHPFRALLGWLLFICWQISGSRWFRKNEVLLRRSIRKEAFRKGIRKGGDLSRLR